MKDAGFTDVFNSCEEIYGGEGIDFTNFREREDIYAFLLGSKEIDCEAIIKAQHIDPVMFSKYLGVPKSDIGYGDRIQYKFIDEMDSRHIMMSNFIFSKNRDYKRIVEIGGGFGNWYRLNRDLVNFESWTIIDLPFSVELQKWYLEREVGDVSKLVFESAYDYNLDGEVDLVIGAHSLSELSWEHFIGYYETVLSKTKYLFYACHKWNCGKELLDKKLQKLEERFELVESIPSEGDTVHNNIYVKRS